MSAIQPLLQLAGNKTGKRVLIFKSMSAFVHRFCHHRMPDATGFGRKFLVRTVGVVPKELNKYKIHQAIQSSHVTMASILKRGKLYVLNFSRRTLFCSVSRKEPSCSHSHYVSIW